MMTDFLLWGIVGHLVADWLFQNDWMASNKMNPKHPAGYVHTLIHFVVLGLVWSIFADLGDLLGPAWLVAVVHWIIDLRWPLEGWRRVLKQTREGPAALHVAIWGDQVLHILVLAIVVLVWQS